MQDSGPLDLSLSQGLRQDLKVWVCKGKTKNRCVNFKSFVQSTHCISKVGKN